MEKKNFISLVFGVVGFLLFSIGMCMCLIPEWNTFTPGCVITIAGFLCLLILFIIRRSMSDKPKTKINWETVGIIIYGVFGTLVFGLGMSMALVFEGLIVQGIIIGVVGIILLLFLIPMIKGLK